jgi:hypothetical protein
MNDPTIQLTSIDPRNSQINQVRISTRQQKKDGVNKSTGQMPEQQQSLNRMKQPPYHNPKGKKWSYSHTKVAPPAKIKGQPGLASLAPEVPVYQGQNHKSDKPTLIKTKQQPPHR